MNRQQPHQAFSILLLLLLGQQSLAASASAAHWPQFRGPGGRSIAPDQRLPESFGPGENERWKTPLPTGHSSPCIWGDRIFLTGYAHGQLKMLCLNRRNGEVQWEQSRPLKDLQRYKHTASSPAVPTACTDGERVCFLFGDYGLVVLNLDGQLIWERQFIPSSSDFGYGASPVIVNDALLVNCDGGLQPSLLCLSLADGETIWQADRPRTIVSYSTPFVWSPGDAVEILLGGSAALTAFDLHSGQETWTVKNLPGFVCTSPAADDRAVYYGAWTTAHVGGSQRMASVFGEEVNLSKQQASDPNAFYARFDVNGDRKIAREELPPSRAREVFNFVDKNENGFWDFEEVAPGFGRPAEWKDNARNVLVSVGAGGRGDVTQTHVRWETAKGLPYVASPLLYRNRLYYVRNGGRVTCLDPSTGQPHFEGGRLGVSGEYYASPLGVGDRILFTARKGSLITLEASDQLEIHQTVDLEEGILATPAIVDNQLYVRTERHLWCFAKAKAVAKLEEAHSLRK